MTNKFIFLGLMLIASISLIGYSLISHKGGKVEKLELEIEMEKLVYPSNSSIPILIRLKNTGNTNIVVNGRMSVNHLGAPKGLQDIAFSVTDPLGEPVAFKASVKISPTDTEDLVILSPGETIEKRDYIETLYDLHIIGSYSIYAIYQNVIESDGNNSTWKGEITSNTVIFEITP